MKRGKPKYRNKRVGEGLCIMEVWFRKGELHYQDRKPHRDGDGAVESVNEAVMRLRRGEKIWILQIARLVNQVQRILEGRQ